MTATPAAGARTEQVVMENIAFQPAQITVTAGTTVEWVNRDAVPHTVTAGTRGNPTGRFDSGFMNGGETFRYTFQETGRFEYFCAIHPGMNGLVIVEP